MQYGWKRKSQTHPLLHFGNYRLNHRDSVINTPPVVDWSGLSTTITDMLGNGDWGDCVEAASDRIAARMGRGRYVPTAGDSLDLYSAITGFNASDPASDQGTDIPTALDWMIRNDIPGFGGRLLGYASVNVNDPVELHEALYIGGNLQIGFDVPYSAEQQFNAGRAWSVVPGSPIVGGHSVDIIAHDTNASVPWNLETWGAQQGMTGKFWTKYVSEAYVLFFEEWIDAVSGNGPNNVAWADLNADISLLFGVSGPFMGPLVNPTVGALDAMESIKGIVGSWDGS